MKLRRAGLTVVVVLSGCADDSVIVRPVYDTPVDDPGAVASGIDTLQLAVARAGSDTDLAAVSFAPGASADLTGVPFADDLVVHLTGRLGGSEVGYGRTCAFAVAADGAAPSPHLWFSRTVRFGSLGVTTRVRTSGVALTAPDGSAFFLVGDERAAATVAERFDPTTGALTDATPLLERVGGNAALLGTGAAARIVVLGGVDGGGGGLGTIELIRLDNGVAVADQLPVGGLARLGTSATTLTDGRIVVIGGRPPGGGPVADLDVVADVAGTVEVKRGNVSLAHPRAGHTATRLGDDVGEPVLVVGGVDAGGAPVGEAELWKPLSDELADLTAFPHTMVVPRSRHIARLMRDGSILVIGGVDAANQPVRVIERYTIDTGFVAVAELATGAGVIDMSATTLPDGRILLVGGRPAVGAPPVATASVARLDEFDGSVDVVAIGDQLAIPRAGHQATLLCDGTVLISGGTDVPSPPERYNPSANQRR